MSMKRIAYVALIMSYQSGVAAKMQRLAETARNENIPIDYYWLTTSYSREEKKVDPVRVMISKWQNPVMTRIWQALVLNRLSREYDALVIRYPLYDPFLDSMVRRKHKIITEHHTKEVTELTLLGSKRKMVESKLGSRWLRKFGGIIGVTEEIVAYEKERSGFSGKSVFIPNSIPVDLDLPLTGKIGEGNLVNIVFVANFRPWHGLGLVIDGLKISTVSEDRYRLHLIGKVPEAEEKELSKFNSVVLHGEMTNRQINELYNEMDFAIGGLNLSVNEMDESTSLKVREYLANGLPTLIGSRDPAFPRDYRYILEKDAFDLDLIMKFVEGNRGLQKSLVRESAEKYISSKYFLQKMYSFATANA